MRLNGRLVLITGASSGIGAATATAVAREGGIPIMLARRADALDAVADAIMDMDGVAYTYPVDLADPDAVAETCRRIRAEAGVPDVIVNNAGAGRWQSLVETGAEDAAQMMAVPVLAAMNVTRAFLPDMVARGNGRIVTVNSVAGGLVWPNACGYITARHALSGWVDALRSELHGSGVTVSETVLGTVESPYWTHNPGSRDHVPKGIPGLMPVLSVDAAAGHVLAAIRRAPRRRVAPPAFRMLFAMRAMVPAAADAMMRQRVATSAAANASALSGAPSRAPQT